MAISDSASTSDVLAALASAGLGSVGTKGSTIENLPHDHGTGNSSVPFLPVSCSDAANDDVGRSDVAQRRDEREEAARGVRKFRRLSAKTSPEKVAADVSGYEHRECSESELVASNCCYKESASNDIPLLRREYNRVMQLERRLVFHSCVKPSLLAKGWKESDALALMHRYKMTDYADRRMRIDLLKEYCQQGV